MLIQQLGRPDNRLGRPPTNISTPSPLLTNLVAYWDMNEASGAREDDSGNGNTLTDFNTVGSTVAFGGTAAQFVYANSEYFEDGDLSVSNTAWEIGFWINFSSTTNAVQVFLWKGTAFNGTSLEFQLAGLDMTTAPYLRLDMGNGSVIENLLLTGLALTTNYYVSIGYDGTNMIMSVNNGTPVTLALGGTSPNVVSSLLIGKNDSTIFSDCIMGRVGYWNGRRLTTDERAYMAGGFRTYADIANYTGS